jgi:hypothetical protein
MERNKLRWVSVSTLRRMIVKNNPNYSKLEIRTEIKRKLDNNVSLLIRINKKIQVDREIANG